MEKKRTFGPVPPTISIDPVDDSGCDLKISGSASVEGAVVHAFLHQNDPDHPVDESYPIIANNIWQADLALPPNSTGAWMVSARYRDMEIIDTHWAIIANCPSPIAKK